MFRILLSVFDLVKNMKDTVYNIESDTICIPDFVGNRKNIINIFIIISNYVGALYFNTEFI